MKIGLFFGTFNPIHNGHIGICKEILEKKIVKEIWLIITPHSPNKNSYQIIDKYLRLDMIKLVISQIKNIKVLDIEFNMKTPNYTYLTLKEIRKKYPLNRYTLIMGEDNFLNIDSWKNSTFVKSNFKIISYPRTIENVDSVFNKFYDISSSMIRDLVKTNSSISNYVPKSVEKFIISKKLYV